MRKRRLSIAVAFAWFALIAPVSLAQAAWPERPITIVVPYAAGGAADVVVRVVAERMSAQLGQPVIIVNRPAAWWRRVRSRVRRPMATPSWPRRCRTR
ncbi:MAG: hypothetical protein WDN48_09570 [Pseudolabrys sp.]